MGGGFKGAPVGGGGESGSARPETDGGQRWAPAAAHKGERRGPARAKGEGKTAWGPDPLGSHNGVFHGRPGAPPRLRARRGRRAPTRGRRQERSPGRRRPRAPRRALRSTGGAQAGGGGGSGPPGGSRRGCCAGAELCAGKKGTRAARRGGRGEGRAGESRGEAAAGEAGARAAGGRRWHRLREPRRLSSQIRNRAPARGLRPPGPRPRRPRPLRPARARSAPGRKPRARRRRRPLPRRRPERIPSRRGGLCVCECAALSPHAWHMRKSELRPKSQPYPP